MGGGEPLIGIWGFAAYMCGMYGCAPYDGMAIIIGFPKKEIYGP